nr:LOW QUALITY PROTEIN: uncharacterized protein LOC119161190 [Rhipicephalus microplus]
MEVSTPWGRIRMLREERGRSELSQAGAICVDIARSKKFARRRRPPVRTAPNGSARQDGSGPTPLQQCKKPGDKPLSRELLETLRRECLERSVCTRVARLPSVIEKAPQPIKLETPFFKTVEPSDVHITETPATASSKTDKSHLRSPSQTLQQSLHQQNCHQHHNQIVRIPLASIRPGSIRKHGSSQSGLRVPRSSPVSVERSQRRSSTGLSSPPPLQSAAQSAQQQQRHNQQPQRHRASEERPQGEGDMVCKKDESEVRAGVAKCNYVLSDNYENLSGDESPASRSLEASNVDHKAIELFLPLVDAMEGQGQNDHSAGATVVASKEFSESASGATEDYDDLPEEGSLVIDDEGVDGDPSAPSGAAVSNIAGSRKVGSGTRLKWPHESPTAVTSEPPHEASSNSPAPRADLISATRNQVVDDATNAASRWQLLKDLKNKRSKLSLPRQSMSASRAYLEGGRPLTLREAATTGVVQPPPLTPLQGESPAPWCPEDPEGDQTRDPRMPWRPVPATPTKKTGGKKQQRKNSEDNHRRGSSSSGEQHGDESRYKRLAQELPGFNWLEQKIMGHGGGNFADASPPISKLVTREAPAVIAAPASERTEQKAPASPLEPKRVYPPGTDILSRSMSEIQDDCCDEEVVGEEAPVMEATEIAPPEEAKSEGEEQPQDMVQQELPREILVTALPDTYTSDPRLSQVITSTALIRPQYPLEVHMAGSNSALEMPVGARGLTTASMMTCVPQGMQEVEGEARLSSKSQADAIAQGRAAPEEQSSDSDVLYLGVSRNSLSPGSEHSGGDHRTSVMTEADKVSERSRSADNNVTQTAIAQKHRAGAPEPINLSDAARRAEMYGTARDHYSFFQPHSFTMSDHQRWLDERRYHEMMNARGPVGQQGHLAPSQISPELSQRRHSGGSLMMPNRMEMPPQYRPPVSERSPMLRQVPPPHQGLSPHQALSQHQSTSSHQPHLQHQSSHQAQLTQQAVHSQQPPPSHQANYSHQGQPSHPPLPPHQGQLLHQMPVSHQIPISRPPQQMHPAGSYYPLPRAHQTQPGVQNFQPLPALTRDTPLRNGRPELYQAQQRYKTMEQAYGMTPHAQQLGPYAVPQLPKQNSDPSDKNMSPATRSLHLKDGKAEPSYKEIGASRSEGMGPGAPPTAPGNAKPPATSPHTQRPESAGHSSQTSSLKTEMEMLKDELKYLDALAAQKEAEYETVVQTRTEKLKTLTQLEARYKRSLEQPQPYSKEDVRYPGTAADVRQGQRPASSQSEKASLVDDPKAVPKQRPSSVGGSGQQKTSPPALSSPLAKTSPGHPAVPGLIPYPLSHPPQQARPPLSLASHPNIPLNMPIMGAGMFNMRNMELQRDFSPMLGPQPLNSPLVPGYGRPYYSLDRNKHPSLHHMEAAKPAVKRKYSPGSAPSLPQSNGEMRSTSSQRSTMVPTGQRQRESEKVTAPLSQEHAQWLHAMKSREAQGAPPGYPTGVQSAFQTYGSFPNRRVLPEDLPLNPAMSNAAWSNYAEGLHGQYALQMAKHGLYPGHPTWSGSEKQQQQRVGEAEGAAMLGREPPAKRPSREEPVIHQMSKDRHMMRPGDKPVAHAALLASQAPPQEQALSAQAPPVPQNPQSKNNTCVMCGQLAQYMCSGCQNIWYCGPQCQRNHWVSHSNVCMGSKR